MLITMSTFPIRLLAPLCGALLLAHAPLALAQDAATPDYPAPSLTPEAAGERFYQFLAAGDVRGADPQEKLFDVGAAAVYVGALQRAQMVNVSARPSEGQLEQLLILLARQKDEPQFAGKIVGTEGEQTLVEVAPAPARKRAVVVVPEDGGYRVDLKATYARWNDLSGEALDIKWEEYTGIVSPALAKNTAYIEGKRRSSCQSNLKQTMLGILQYSQDYNENFPTARKWVDGVMPYVRSEQIFRCPALPVDQNYGYAYNQNLNALSQSKMDKVAQTVAIYETDDLTRNAFGVADERAYRHMGGSNIAFVDGHIKWYAQGQEPQDEVNFKP